MITIKSSRRLTRISLSRTIFAAGAVAAFGLAGSAQAGINPDIDKSGHVGVEDLSAYITLYLAGDKNADVDDNKVISVDDLFNFIDTWVREMSGASKPVDAAPTSRPSNRPAAESIIRG